MTRLQSELIGPGDPRWQALLDRVPHDAYHRPEYVEVCARHEGGAPVAFLASEGSTQLLLPLLLRELPAELDAPPAWHDLTSPYGYPGPVVSSSTDADFPGRAFDAFRELGRAEGLVSAFVRMHPLLPLPAGPSSALDGLEAHGPVVWIDLTRSAEELWSDTRSNHRRGIRKLTRSGFSVAIDDWDRYPHFVSVYEETMRRVEATPFYFFPPGYYEDLRVALDDGIHLCTVLSPEGDVACAGVFFETAGIVEYHLGGTSGDFLSVAPSKLMFDVVRSWARDRGNRMLHLGGGHGGREDSLFHFKAGFSSSRARFYTVRMVLDETRHAELLQRCDAKSAGGFFPAYRAPGALAVR